MPEPVTATGYYTDLAAALRQVADQLATLSGTETRPPGSANIYLGFGYDESSAHLYVPAVDAIAGALGTAAVTKFEGRGAHRRGEHKAVHRQGPIRVNVYTAVPVPPTRRQTMAELARENDELRARLGAKATEDATAGTR